MNSSKLRSLHFNRSIPRLDKRLEWEYICDEPGGPVIRRVVEVRACPLLEQFLHESLPKGKDTPIRDLAHLYHPEVRVFLVDMIGVMIQGYLWVDGLIDVHIAFWDRRLRGREGLCRAMAEEVAADRSYRGVWTAIPMESRATLAFAQRVGFQPMSVTSGGLVRLELIT